MDFSDWLLFLADRMNNYCQEADEHSLEGFSIDLASLIEGELSDGRKYLLKKHRTTENNSKVKDFSSQLSFLSSYVMSHLTVVLIPLKRHGYLYPTTCSGHRALEV